MSDERPDQRLYAQAKAILQRVFEMPPADRGAYLESACGHNPELRAEVFSLLAAHEEIQSQFLDNPFTAAGDANADDEDRDLTGQRVGAYRLERLLGRGGMGAVYLASRDDGEFKKQVAIKFIRPSMATPSLLKRFRAERQILADIDHPNIARLIDGGTAEGGIPFFIMENVPGETLTQVLARGPLPAPRAMNLATAVSDVLEALHSKGLVFRDLKPSNIMLTEAGGVKVLDFGIAKITKDDASEQTTQLTESGWIVGSPRYMSPEQASGEAVDARSDVFSFGVVMFETLTGRLPFRGDSRKEYLKSLMSGAPESLPPDVPAKLRAIVERCLRHAPGERFASGRDLARAVRDVANTDARKSAAGRLWAAVAALAIVVAIGVWAALQPRPESGGPFSGPPQLITTWASNERTPRFSPNLRFVSFVTDRDGPEKILVRDRTSGAERSIVPLGGTLKDKHEWSPSSDQIAYLAVSPSAMLNAPSVMLTLAPIDGGQPRVFELPNFDAVLVRWIGNGIYYWSSDSLWRFDLLTGRSTEVTTERGPLDLRSVDVSADERRIVFTASKDTINFIWSAAINGSGAVQLTDRRMNPRNPRWRGAQAREVVYVSEEGGMSDIWLLDVTSRRREPLTRTEARETVLDVSRDGTTLVFEQIRETAHVAFLDPASNAPAVQELTSDSLGDLLPVASASAKEFAFQRSRTMDLALGFQNATIQFSGDGLAGGQSEKLADGYAPALSPDGRWLAYSVQKPGESRDDLWMTGLQTRRPVLVSNELRPSGYQEFPLARSGSNMAWSPQGPRLYFLTKDGIWSATPAADGQSVDARRLIGFKDAAADISDLHVSGDGSRLSYLVRSRAKAATDLRCVVLTRNESRDDRVCFTEAIAFGLSNLGWTANGEPVVVRETAGRARYDVIVVRDDRDDEVARGLKDVIRFSFALDPRRRIVYFTRASRQTQVLYALFLDTREDRLLRAGEQHGPALSAIQVLGDGRLLFSTQTQNHDVAANTFSR